MPQIVKMIFSSLAYLDIHSLRQFSNNNIDSAHGLRHDNTTIIKLKHTITGLPHVTNHLVV
jgi:hypothetical protein